VKHLAGLAVASACSTSLTSPVFAQETQTYSYDALGRLVQVFKAKTSAPATPVATQIQYGPTNNRTTYSATAVPDASSAGSVIVVPLLGFVVSPIH
jgi:hypothetical protein